MMNFTILDYPILQERDAWEVMFLQRRIAYLFAEYNDKYNAGAIQNFHKDVSSTRKLITSLKELDKDFISDPREY
jgi:hypothetical protein